MKKLLWLWIVAAVCAAQINDIGGERIRAHVKFLASDLLEGRGPGTRGGKLAAQSRRTTMHTAQRPRANSALAMLATQFTFTLGLVATRT